MDFKNSTISNIVDTIVKRGAYLSKLLFNKQLTLKQSNQHCPLSNRLIISCPHNGILLPIIILCCLFNCVSNDYEGASLVVEAAPRSLNLMSKMAQASAAAAAAASSTTTHGPNLVKSARLATYSLTCPPEASIHPCTCLHYIPGSTFDSEETMEEEVFELSSAITTPFADSLVMLSTAPPISTSSPNQETLPPSSNSASISITESMKYSPMQSTSTTSSPSTISQSPIHATYSPSLITTSYPSSTTIADSLKAVSITSIPTRSSSELTTNPPQNQSPTSARTSYISFNPDSTYGDSLKTESTSSNTGPLISIGDYSETSFKPQMMGSDPVSTTGFSLKDAPAEITTTTSFSSTSLAPDQDMHYSSISSPVQGSSTESIVKALGTTPVYSSSGLDYSAVKSIGSKTSDVDSRTTIDISSSPISSTIESNTFEGSEFSYASAISAASSYKPPSNLGTSSTTLGLSSTIAYPPLVACTTPLDITMSNTIAPSTSTTNTTASTPSASTNIATNYTAPTFTASDTILMSTLSSIANNSGSTAPASSITYSSVDTKMDSSEQNSDTTTNIPNVPLVGSADKPDSITSSIQTIYNSFSTASTANDLTSSNLELTVTNHSFISETSKATNSSEVNPANYSSTTSDSFKVVYLDTSGVGQDSSTSLRLSTTESPIIITSEPTTPSPRYNANTNPKLYNSSLVSQTTEQSLTASSTSAPLLVSSPETVSPTLPSLIVTSTSAPTSASTTAPTSAPTSASTSAPTSASTTAPTSASTSASTSAPTSASTTAPTSASTTAPTSASTLDSTSTTTAPPNSASAIRPNLTSTRAPHGHSRMHLSSDVASSLHQLHSFGRPNNHHSMPVSAQSSTTTRPRHNGHILTPNSQRPRPLNQRPGISTAAGRVYTSVSVRSITNRTEDQNLVQNGQSQRLSNARRRTRYLSQDSYLASEAGDSTKTEVMAYCKNIQNPLVLREAIKGFRGHQVTYFVIDSCKVPPFPNDLFAGVDVRWLEMSNSTVQFHDNFLHARTHTRC